MLIAHGLFPWPGGLSNTPEALLIYFADLHLHSKFSRATSKDCDLTRLAQWAALKGVRVVTTGDFTHPAWRQEIKDMLVPVEDGLFRLRDEHVPPGLAQPPGGFGPEEVRFLLGVEISSIYKKNGATRKVHNLVYMPDLDSMDRFQRAAGPHRQYQLGWSSHPGAGQPGTPGDFPGDNSGVFFCSRPHLDSLVFHSGVAVGVRLGG